MIDPTQRDDIWIVESFVVIPVLVAAVCLFWLVTQGG